MGMSINTNVLKRCNRTKNYMVNEYYIEALKESFNLQAEHLPEDSFYPLYIGKALLKTLIEAGNHSLVWGRRGTGKTHLLKAFVQKVNSDNSLNRIAFYISCENTKYNFKNNLKFENDMLKMEFLAQKNYIRILISLLEDLAETYSGILESKEGWKELSDAAKRERCSTVDICIHNLKEYIGVGIPVDENRKWTQVIRETDSNKNKKKSAFNFGFPKVLNRELLDIGYSKDSQRNQTVQTDMTAEFKYELDFRLINSEFKRLIQALGVDCLYICLDELCAVDQQSGISFQPLLLDYFKRSIFNIRGIKFIITSNREITNLNTKTSFHNFCGVQSGHDIHEETSIDTMHLSDEAIKHKFTRILTARINYFAKEIYEKNNELHLFKEFSPEYIIESIFHEEQNYNVLLSLSQGLPRNYFNILQSSLGVLDFNIKKKFVHKHLVRDVVIYKYKYEERSNIPMNYDSIYNMITDYVDKSKNYIFLLSSEQDKMVKSELSTLIHLEAVHRIPSAQTPSRLMNRYKAYFVESGMYFDVLSGLDNNDSDQYLLGYSLELPQDIVENLDSYIINIDSYDKNRIECPNCSSTFSDSHSVYQKLNACNTCGFTFSD